MIWQLIMVCSKTVLYFSALGTEHPASLKCFLLRLLKSSGNLSAGRLHSLSTFPGHNDQQIIFIFEWILIIHILFEVKSEEAMAKKYNII